VTLVSQVKNKQYFSFALETKKDLLSRPINEAFFENDIARIEKQWSELLNLKGAVLARLLYTAAVSFCAAIDLFDRNNKKEPATYFEILVGHLFARVLGTNPQKKAAVPLDSKTVKLTMDFLFELGPKRKNIHLPVKMSTRERVVQAWAHQRILDASFGKGKYLGVLVVFSETKLDLKKREVIEICVPEQWLAYQTLIARMERIYYFDVPKRYLDLAAAHSIIVLKNFHLFFEETKEVLAAQS